MTGPTVATWCGRLDQSFAELAATLARCGWTPVELERATLDVRPGEPELAVWRRDSAARVVMTFNPVVELRLLEGRGNPDALRALRAATGELSAADVSEAAASDDPRRQLLATLAWPHVDSAPDSLLVEALFSKTAAVAHAAAAALLEVDSGMSARTATREAHEILAQLAAGQVDMVSLRPGGEDHERLFIEPPPDVVSRDAQRWRVPPSVPPGPWDLALANRRILSTHNPVSEAFLRGYRRFAARLAPAPVWVIATGCDGTVLDGLVCVEGRWRLCPRPFQLIS